MRPSARRLLTVLGTYENVAGGELDLVAEHLLIEHDDEIAQVGYPAQLDWLPDLENGVFGVVASVTGGGRVDEIVVGIGVGDNLVGKAESRDGENGGEAKS